MHARGAETFPTIKAIPFLTFSCFQRMPRLREERVREMFIECLERTRLKYSFRVYGYVVMPEHVHLLLSEPESGTLAKAIQALKISSARREMCFHEIGDTTLWQKRYYDHNVRNYDSFVEKLRYIHRNPVKRGLVNRPEDWTWSSFRHYLSKLSRNGLQIYATDGLRNYWRFQTGEAPIDGAPYLRSRCGRFG